MPYMIRKKSPDRAGLWDIVNEESNRIVWENITSKIINYEEALGGGVQVQKVAKYMEEDLVPQVKNREIYICYGDDDLYFSQDGFESLAKRFKSAGNKVTSIRADNSGHMILFDNGADEVKKLVLYLLNRKS